MDSVDLDQGPFSDRHIQFEVAKLAFLGYSLLLYLSGVNLVYVFNLSSSYVEYSVNDGRIPPGQPIVPEAGYRPNSTAVQRAKYREPKCFGQGENRFFARFRDLSPPLPGEATYAISIPAASSLLDDFLLYVFRTQVALLDHSGRVLSQTWPQEGAPLTT